MLSFHSVNLVKLCYVVYFQTKKATDFIDAKEWHGYSVF